MAGIHTSRSHRGALQVTGHERRRPLPRVEHAQSFLKESNVHPCLWVHLDTHRPRSFSLTEEGFNIVEEKGSSCQRCDPGICFELPQMLLFVARVDRRVS